MKKIKISELPLYSSLKGLFTIGTDNENRSVKVSLEFVEDETNKAVKNAENATEATKKATALTEAATKKATALTEAAKTATTNTVEATRLANEATEKSKTATTEAIAAKDAAVEATEAANTATDNAKTATADTEAATAKADTATEAAQQATTQVLDTLGRLVPTALAVRCIKRITLGNLVSNRIEAIIQPENVMKNLIFMSDNKAVSVAPDGVISVVGKGVSTVHIIPTCNTALAKSVTIEVGEPTLRLVNTRSQLRFTAAGGLRLN